MFFLDEDETRYVIRGLAPRARGQGVAEELRGWRWDSAPLAPLYEGALQVAEVADQLCPTNRDVYLRHVLGVRDAVSVTAALEDALQLALTTLVVAAKRAIYEHGALAPDEIRRLSAPAGFAVPEAGRPADRSLEAASYLLWEFERRRIAARVEAVLARQPQSQADALVASALPVTVGRRLDGRYLGLAAHVSLDAVGFPEPVAFSLRHGAPQPWHRLVPTGYALLLEALHETPVNIGCIAYATFEDGQVGITRDLFVIDDELRQSFIDARDERARLVEEEIDPGLPGVCPETCPMLARCHG